MVGTVVAQVGPELIPIALVVGAGGAVAAGFTVITGRRRIRAARQTAQAIRSGVRDAYVTLDSRWESLLNDVVVARGTLADDDGYAVHIQNQRQQATDALKAATSRYVQAEADHDLDVRTGLATITTATEHWQAVNTAVQEAGSEVEQLADLVAEIDSASDRCRELLGDIDTRMVTARRVVGQAAEDGYLTTELEAALAGVITDRTVGEQALGERRLWDANAALRRVDQTVSRVDATARSLAPRRASLLSRHTELATAAEAAAATVTRIADVLSSLRADFAPSVWESIDSGPTVAADTLADVGRELDIAAQTSSMQAQQFDAADQALAAATAHLQLLDRVNVDVLQVRHDADAAVAEYPNAHTEAVRSLDDARRFTRQFARAVNPAHQASLDRAASILQEAEAMAARRRADPFIAVQRLNEVDAVTDAILHAARNEKQQFEARRNHAAAAIRDASRTVRRAHSASGLGVFGWSARAKAQLAAADTALAEANAVIAADPGRAAFLGIEAGQIASQILDEHRRRRRNQGYHRR